MSGILTIALNPAVDLATSVEAVFFGPKLICKQPHIDPGGGCANAASAICKLGERAVVHASDVVALGVARTAVTGRELLGEVMVTEGGRFHCTASRVPVRSKVGAGNAFVGAMTLAIARGEPDDQALRWGVAAASATDDAEGTVLCEPDRTQTLFKACTVRAL